MVAFSTAPVVRLNAIYSFGWYYRQANYNQYKLRKTGVDIQIALGRYVQPVFRFSGGYAQIFGGDASSILTSGSGGGSTGLGFGLRIPIIRWISLTAIADYNWTFFLMSEELPNGTTGVIGGQLTGSFGLTFQVFDRPK